MKTIYGRINDIEDRITVLGGGAQCVTAFYHTANDKEPFKVTATPSEKPVTIHILVGDGFVPPDLRSEMALPA